jgi:hypothetical protein
MKAWDQADELGRRNVLFAVGIDPHKVPAYMRMNWAELPPQIRAEIEPAFNSTEELLAELFDI